MHVIYHSKIKKKIGKITFTIKSNVDNKYVHGKYIKSFIESGVR